jgi:hypothetical protein
LPARPDSGEEPLTPSTISVIPPIAIMVGLQDREHYCDQRHQMTQGNSGAWRSSTCRGIALLRPSDRCRELAGKITAQGSAVAQQRTRRRRAPDCDLARRDDARHGGRATPRFAWCGAGCSVTAGHHRPSGGGDGCPASAAAPGSVHTREGAALCRRPGADSPPAFPAHAIALAVLPASLHAFPPGQLAPCVLLPG